MNKVKFHYGKNPVQFNVETDKNVNVYIDTFYEGFPKKNEIIIVILEEPRKGGLYKRMKGNPRKYTHLLTFHEELLDKKHKARKFLMMKSWITNYQVREKEFSVSTVVGGKSWGALEGYQLRHDLWYARDEIKIPKKFYLSGNAEHFHSFVTWDDVSYEGELVLGASKEPLFDSMFHIAIESCSIRNYFSEKLLDCFQTRTVPIYWGCMNISEYFNIKGILVVRSLKEIVDICNGLTQSMYFDLQDAIEDNYQRAQRWVDPVAQVEEAVKDILASK